MEPKVDPSTSTDYSKENYNSQRALPSMLAQPIQSNESEPWRGGVSSGFGLANLLNRNVSTENAAPPPLPSFSLPSLHAFGKPLVTKTEGYQTHSTLLPASSHHSANSSEQQHSEMRRHQHHQQHEPSSPSDSRKSMANGQPPASRRIAPAPAEDDDCDPDDENNTSIRGGRWTADEHERFLAGFRIHGHKWKRVQQVVRTRSVTQVRTHAQKYLLKVAKLKAEKKQSNKVIDVVSLNERYLSHSKTDSGSDNETTGQRTAPSTPEGSRDGYEDDGGRAHLARSSSNSLQPPRKKHRGAHYDTVDQEYIAAAAMTLCFLMSQKIDSIFENRQPEPKESKDLEPYDCYSPSARGQGHQRTQDSESDSRKRTYMHFLTESPVQYRHEQYSYEESASRSDAGGASSYAIEAEKLYS